MKKTKFIWKRFLLWIGAAVMLLSAIGCVKPEDEAEPTMQLDMVQLVETAANGDAGMPLSAIGAPKHCNVQIQSADERLKIRVDADVIVPDVDGMPMVQVHPADFSQALVYRLFQTLCGDVPMYRARTQSTKAEIQAAIDQLEKELPEITDPISKEIWQLHMSNLQAELETAPDTIHDTTTDGTMWETSLDVCFIGKRMELGAYEYPHATRKGKTISVLNNITYSNDDENADRYAGAQVTYMGTDFRQEPAMLPFRRIADATVIPSALVGKIDMLPQEAGRMVESFLRQIDLPETVVTGLYYPDMEYIDTQWEMEPMFGYIVSCSETYRGVPVAILQGGAAEQADEAGIPFRSWNYQEHYYYVDETGIRFIRWASPYSVKTVQTADVQMLPFSEIQTIFEKMVQVAYQPNDHIALTELCIDRVALELFRIREHDSLENGLLLPVWNYYGSCQQILRDGHGWHTDSHQGFPIPLLTINAIDGSVIDVAKGY